MPLPPLSPTPRSRLGRKKDRAATDRAELYALLDEALLCHLGIVLDGAPVVLPTGYGRDGDTLYLHGSTGARSLRAAADGLDVCVTVTLLDGIVYARSLNNHSMNYRSAVVHGVALPVQAPEDKRRALRVVTDHLAPGSWGYARDVSARELAGVAVLALDLAEASVKVRAGAPGDDEADLALGVWAGVLPVRTVFGEPAGAPDQAVGLAVPAHVRQRAQHPVPAH